ncbi:MAG TPA: transglutaminase family protein [Phenylobacterium sp.]|uniref:transglutaminase family protein n=1 Tax=Phenylobacterium sp. TaxID=1871053 RepID=UPI002B4974DC|nr:transglutaminase family protein [Phenylobacterium sp.]HKR86811.1 transglutaminase family protein [Phenylobacterium sp.]
MIYTVRHRTTYRYEEEVSFAQCVLRLTPRSTPNQTVLRSAVVVQPKPAQTQVGRGAFAERTLRVQIDTPHEVLEIESRSRVDVHVPPIGDPAHSEAWQDVRRGAFEDRDLGPEGPAAFLYPTQRTPNAAAISDYARQSFAPDRPIVEACAELMRRIRRDFEYSPQATTVSTPTPEAFARRHGVCQDFAHVMISGLRGLGLPAAYVSGYLRTIPPPGQPRLEGADATHAWVQVWCGRARGWIGFDPTNAIFAENDHIMLAVGRDYADVAPIDGVILASGVQTLAVEVDVIPDDGVLPPTLAAALVGR